VVHNRCSANFAGAAGPVASVRDTVADSVSARVAAAARANAGAASSNFADEIVPGGNGRHVAADTDASRAADCFDWNTVGCWNASRGPD
jgi:hypothetical protein